MCKFTKLLISFSLLYYFDIINADQHEITAGCDGDKICIQFSDCAVNTTPTTTSIGTIYTIDNTTVQFQLQYDNANADWIAMGLSTTPNMPNSNIFMCVRTDEGVAVQERLASAQARPPIVASDLTPVNYINDQTIINCTFTTPVLGIPNLNIPEGYYVLLAWGTASDEGVIQQHLGDGVGRCFSSNEIVITIASGMDPTTEATTPEATTIEATTTEATTTEATTTEATTTEATTTEATTTEATTTQPSNLLVGEGCDTIATCIQFSDCAVNTAPTTPSIGTISTIDDTTVQFQLQYDNANADWIAMGLSTTQNMLDSNIFMCVRSGDEAVEVEERFATARALPTVATSDLSLINSINDASIINCTFTTPVLGTPNLNRPEGYYVLLAWGTVSDEGVIQQHLGDGVGRCFSSSRMRITAATGGAPLLSNIFPSFLQLFLLTILLLV